MKQRKYRKRFTWYTGMGLGLFPTYAIKPLPGLRWTPYDQLVKRK